MRNLNKSPILFLIFNRPDTTQLVFNEIKKYKPTKLYIASDGPRNNKTGESELCEKTRNIINQIDWRCEVKKLFRKNNLGCKLAVSSAIDWFFKNEEEGIIIEDDCLPNQSFFKFCEELLEKYRYNNRIGMISGDNFQKSKKIGNTSYYFSNHAHIWGWATWRRVWERYYSDIDNIKDEKINEIVCKTFSNKIVSEYYSKQLLNVKMGLLNTLDYQFSLLLWKENLLSIIPNVNLVKNIGVGPDSTHGNNKKTPNTFIDTKELIFPFVHPDEIVQNSLANRKFERNNILKEIIKKKLYDKIIKLKNII